MRYFFARLDEKHKLFGNFEKFLKIFDKKFIRKMECLRIFGKVIAKKRAFGNNIIFLQQFFSISEVGTFPVIPPGCAYAFKLKIC